MQFTDEQISTFCNAGLEINSEILKAIEDSIDKLIKIFEPIVVAAIEAVAVVVELAKRISDAYKEVDNSPPQQRYKMVKKLGVNTYPVFFRRKALYHCRNNY